MGVCGFFGFADRLFGSGYFLVGGLGDLRGEVAELCRGVLLVQSLGVARGAFQIGRGLAGIVFHRSLIERGRSQPGIFGRALGQLCERLVAFLRVFRVGGCGRLRFFDGLLGHFFGGGVFRLGSAFELILGGGKGVLVDLVQLFPHLGIFGEFRLQFREQILGGLFREFGGEFGLRELLVDLVLQPQLGLGLAQLRARLLHLPSRVERLEMPGDAVQRVHEFLLLHERAVEIAAQLRGVAADRGLAERLLGGGRRIFEQRQRIVGVAHAGALIFPQDILHIGVSADEVLERFEAAIDVLLPRELRERAGLDFIGLRGRGFLCELARVLFQRGFFPGQSEREFAHGRREFREVFPRGFHGAAQVAERQPHPGRQLLHGLARAAGHVAELAPLAHFHRGRGEGLARGNPAEQRRRGLRRLAGDGIFQPELPELIGRHLQAGGEPRPIARGRGPHVRHLQFPALRRGQRAEAVRQLLEVVPAFQKAQALAEHVKTRGGFFRAVAAREREHRGQRDGGPAEIADEGVVRRGARLFEVGVRFAKIARTGPTRFEQSAAVVRGQPRLLRDDGGLRAQPVHGLGGRPQLGEREAVHTGHGIRGTFHRAGEPTAPGARRLAGQRGETPARVHGILQDDAEELVEVAERLEQLRAWRFAGQGRGGRVAGPNEKFPLQRDLRVGRDRAGVLDQRFERGVERGGDAEQRVQAHGHALPVGGRLAFQREIADAPMLGGKHEAQLRGAVDLLGGEIKPRGELRHLGERPRAGRAEVQRAHEIARGGRRGVGGEHLETPAHRQRGVDVRATEQPAELDEVGAFMIGRCFAQRAIEREPRGGKLRLEIR